MKIAVYSPNWVGDAALALPFIHELKSQNPEAKIIIVCKDWVESVFLHNPCIDDIVSLSAHDVKGVINTISTGISLRKKKDRLFLYFDRFFSKFCYYVAVKRDLSCWL
jgi:ADP-heptose:LPS heptosyltransferase